MIVDYDRDLFLNEQARKLLSDYYLQKNEKSPQDGFARAALAFSGGDEELAQRIYDYASNGWFMYSSPILSNAGATDGSLPISCFLNYVPDTLEGLIEHSAETRWLSVKGGGVGGHWSDVRAVSDKAPGPMPFLHTIDADMVAYRQGKTRKGSYAAYMDISHPDIIEFINMRIPTGDVNRKNLNTHHGVNIPDAFMQAVKENGSWDLIDPKTKEIKETLQARKVWELILETRYRTGEPYLHFIDTSNNALPKEQKELGLRINGSNLCLTGDTQIRVLIDNEEKNVTLREVVDLVNSGKDISVESKNTHTNDVEYKKITAAALMSKNARLMLIEDDATGKSIKCTPDHKIYTKNRGYIMAKDLVETDILDIR